MSRQEDPGVFHSEWAFEKALHEISHCTKSADEESKDQSNEHPCFSDHDSIKPPAGIEHKCAHESENYASTETFPAFLRTNMRAHFMISVRTFRGKAADYICAGIVYPNEDKKCQEEPLIQEIEEWECG